MFDFGFVQVWVELFLCFLDSEQKTEQWIRSPAVHVVFENLVESMPRRLELVIQAQGNMTKSSTGGGRDEIKIY